MRSAIDVVHVLAPAAVLAIGLAGSSPAATIRVPADAATIQAGLDLATAFDTVLVAAGTYSGAGNRDLDFRGRPVRLISEAGPAMTTIQIGASAADPHRAVTMRSGETRACEISGFTIRGGYGPSEPRPTTSESIAGAILCRDGASPTIRNCVFLGNSAGGHGGAIDCIFGGCAPLIEGCTFQFNQSASGGGVSAIDASPLIVSTRFFDNIVTGGGGAIQARYQCHVEVHDSEFARNTRFGVSVEQSSTVLIEDSDFEQHPQGALGFHLDCDVTVRRSTFTSNTRSQLGSFVRGGAINVDQNCTLHVEDCTFTGNTGGDAGGAIWLAASAAEIMRSEFQDNHAPLIGWRGGGAIAWFGGSGIVTECRFAGNTALRYGGALYWESILASPGMEIRRSVFHDNSASRGGAIFSKFASPLFAECTFASNTAGDAGSAVYDQNTEPGEATIERCIVAFNTGGAALACHDSGSRYVMSCTDVFGNAGGDWVDCIAVQRIAPGNFSLDPGFCNLAARDYTLHDSSPCLPDHNPRGYPCDRIGALEVGCGPTTGIESVHPVIRSSWGRIKNGLHR